MRLLYAIVLLSGACGLAYQVVWARMFQQVFGVSLHAVAAVVATFLAGLSLGGWALSGRADRSQNPLRMYACLELGIALSAVAGWFLLPSIEPLELWAARHFQPTSVWLVLIRMLLASIIILPPTALMGATLPAAARALVWQVDQVGSRVSLLYACNTLGALLGCLLSGFALIRSLGLFGTVLLAASANVVAGLAALLLASRLQRNLLSIDADRANVAETRFQVGSRRAAVRVLAVIGAAGFVAISLQVLWTRLLILVVGTSSYAYVCVLAAFLAGIVLGSLLAPLVLALTRDAAAALGWLLLGIGLSALITVPATGWINSGQLQAWVAGFSGHWGAAATARFGVALLLMIVPTTLMGATFPVACHLYVRSPGAVGRGVGMVLAANTAGNVIGALAGGFLLIPWLGVQRSILLLASAAVAAAAIQLLTPIQTAGQLRRAAHWSAAAAAALLCAWLWMGWEPQPLLSAALSPAPEVVFYEEGPIDSVMVLQDRQDPRRMEMSVNGVIIGQSLDGVDDKQQMLAHLPFVLKAHSPRSILTIGLGSGIVSGEVLKHSGVELVECAEISPSVIRGAALFAPLNGNVLNHSSIRLVQDDGLALLRRTEDVYDAIICDGKSATTHCGNAVFFSREYYELCQRRLADDGLMVQWAPLDVAPADLKVILRSFAATFQQAYVLSAPPSSLFLVGSPRPLHVDRDHIERMLSDPATAGLRRYGWSDSLGFAAAVVLDRQGIQSWVGDGPVNSLAHPMLEFYRPADYSTPAAERTIENLKALRAVGATPADLRLTGFDDAELTAARQSLDVMLEAAVLLKAGEDAALAQAMVVVRQSSRTSPATGPLRHLGATICLEAGYRAQAAGDAAAALEHFRQAEMFCPDDPLVHRSLAVVFERLNYLQQAAVHFGQALTLDPGSPEVRIQLAWVLGAQGQTAQATQYLEDALRLHPGSARAHVGLGIIAKREGFLGKADEHFEAAVQLDPTLAEEVAKHAPQPTSEEPQN